MKNNEQTHENHKGMTEEQITIHLLEHLNKRTEEIKFLLKVLILLVVVLGIVTAVT